MPSDVSITHIIDSQGERPISSSGANSVRSPFKLKGTDVAGHGGSVAVNGMTFNNQPYQANGSGVWQTDDFTISPTGSYSAQATCSSSQEQSNVVPLSVT